MKLLNNYNQYIFENIEYQEEVELFAAANVLESIITDSESLLKTIEAEEVSIKDYFDFNLEDLSSLESLYKDPLFDKTLVQKGYNKSKIEYSKDYDTFLEKTLDIKFFLIYKKEKSSLDPEYLVFQHKVKQEPNYEPVKMYRVKGDMRKFYDNLTTKTIELKKDGNNYIYITSNSGGDWVLKNIESEDGTFKKLLGNQDIKNILQDKSISLTIVA